MSEYDILKDQLFNERETYNFIDKLGYDDWNKKQVIREYIKHIREENQQLKFQLEYEKENLMFSKDYAKCLEEKRDKYRSVLDEIREQLKLERKIALSLNKPYTVSVIDRLLDKVKE